jgi:hypothetical protein
MSLRTSSSFKTLASALSSSSSKLEFVLITGKNRFILNVEGIGLDILLVSMCSCIFRFLLLLERSLPRQLVVAIVKLVDEMSSTFLQVLNRATQEEMD